MCIFGIFEEKSILGVSLLLLLVLLSMDDIIMAIFCTIRDMIDPGGNTRHHMRNPNLIASSIQLMFISYLFWVLVDFSAYS